MSKRTSYKNYMNYYASTSEAFAIDGYTMGQIAAPNHIGNEVVARPRRKKAHRSKSAARRKSIIYSYVHSNERFFSFRMIITLTMIFVGIIFSTMSFATTKKSQLEISAMRENLRSLQEDEAGLRMSISEEYDATNIENIAIMRLNMSKPRPHQMVYISVPKQSYVVQHGVDNAEENTGLLQVFSGVMSRLGL